MKDITGYQKKRSEETVNVGPIGAYQRRDFERAGDRKITRVSPRTVNIELKLLRHMFNIAIKLGYLQKNTTEDVKFLREPKKQMRILSREEEGKLLAVAPPHLNSFS